MKLQESSGPMMGNKTLLIIGFVFPEPDTTAAGVRMMQLIGYFQSSGYRITFATTATSTKYSVDFNQYDLSVKHIALNSDSFDELLRELNPGWVLYDRFISEEQFGWRVREICPEAINILDTEDLHFLREARKESMKTQSGPSKSFYNSDKAKREIASVYRSDLSLIISEYEIKLLQEKFRIPPALLFYLPLFATEDVPSKELVQPGDFYERSHFMTMGNLKHEPNKDAIRYLQSEIWPLIRKELPKAEIHVYGAYADQSVLGRHNEKEGFILKGWAPEKESIYSSYRVCLAPLRFGAGLKGKLLDAMAWGLPSVTTPIGAEGIVIDANWNGFVCERPAEFAQRAVQLYQENTTWQKAVQKGFQILRTRFDRGMFRQALDNRLTSLDKNLQRHREDNFTGAMLRHHLLQSTKYFSKWIEAKNSKR